MYVSYLKNLTTAGEPTPFTEKEWEMFETLFEMIENGQYYRVCWGLGKVAADNLHIGKDTMDIKGVRRFKLYTMAMSQILPSCINLNPELEPHSIIKKGLQKEWEYPDVGRPSKGYEQIEKILEKDRDPNSGD